MKNPPHPGDFIRAKIIEPAALSVTAKLADQAHIEVEKLRANDKAAADQTLFSLAVYWRAW